MRWSITVSVLLTVLFIAVLSVRMAAGADPALGPKVAREPSTVPATAPTATEPPDQVPLAPATQVPTVPVQPAPVAPAPVQTTTS